MAIAKMKKVTLISFHEKKEQLLTAIQTLQSLEVIDLPAAKENLQSLSPKERESIEQNIKKTESYLENVTEALSFLKSYLKKESLIKQYTNPRQSLSLEELEKAVGEFSSDKVLDKVLGLKPNRRNSKMLKNIFMNKRISCFYGKNYHSIREIQQYLNTSQSKWARFLRRSPTITSQT